MPPPWRSPAQPRSAMKRLHAAMDEGDGPDADLAGQVENLLERMADLEKANLELRIEVSQLREKVGDVEFELTWWRDWYTRWRQRLHTLWYNSPHS